MAPVVHSEKAQPAAEDWSREFRELGPDGVRARLIGGSWGREKKAAARIWIETADAVSWQQKRGDGAAGSPSFILRMRGATWWRYVAPLASAAMGAGFLYRRLKGF